MNRTFLCLVFILTNFCFGVAADDIYRWVDESGVVHFTSQPNDPRAKKANLPEITRARMGNGESRLATCDKHGGINCQAGADSDGSVVCLDGFKDASARFRFSCSSARLRIAKMNYNKEQESLNVFVRNQQAIAGRSVEVYFMENGRQRRDFSGPAEVKAYGVAEYKLPLTPEVIEADPDHKTRVHVRCMNCS